MRQMGFFAVEIAFAATASARLMASIMRVSFSRPSVRPYVLIKPPEGRPVVVPRGHPISSCLFSMPFSSRNSSRRRHEKTLQLEASLRQNIFPITRLSKHLALNVVDKTNF